MCEILEYFDFLYFDKKKVSLKNVCRRKIKYFTSVFYFLFVVRWVRETRINKQMRYSYTVITNYLATNFLALEKRIRGNHEMMHKRLPENYHKT